MAIQKIEYQNKEALIDDPTILEKNKVTADNMNELKSVINNNADLEVTTDAIVSSVSSASTNSQIPGAKLFYDTIGDLESILESLDIGNGVS